MSYLDILTTVSGSLAASTNVLTGQAITATAVSTNAIDLGTGVRDVGEGETLYARFTVTKAFSTGTSVDMQVVVADNANLTTGQKVLAATTAVAIANLTLGARFALAVPPQIGSKGQEFLGAKYVVVGTTDGEIVCDFGLDIQDGAKFYPTKMVVA